MNPETTSDKHTPAVDNELDIRGLCCTLWRGKPWIIGIAVLFAAVALIVSYLVKQEWSATAITECAGRLLLPATVPAQSGCAHVAGDGGRSAEHRG
jgi:LPS O-antigen subunit length determinant protein (WzzB/FepE family)